MGIHCSKFLSLKGLIYMYPGIQNKEIFFSVFGKIASTRKRKYDSMPHRACAVCCFTSSYVKTSAPVCIPAQVTKTVFSGDRFQKPTFENLLFLKNTRIHVDVGFLADVLNTSPRHAFHDEPEKRMHGRLF